MSGRVVLVGAGPGDPELLTLRAVRELEQADLVLYDALVSPEVLALATHAQRFSVGKRAFRPSMRQEAIHALMIRAARRGKRVVRLKGGDPFVFGRGGEEVLALRQAGVAYEVVPGVSSAVSAPALAGIPVTHRGLATAFTVVSGHAEAAWKPVLAGIATRGHTVVVPAALPGYLAGLRQGWAFSWRSLMAAEIIAFGGTIGFGLGSMLQQSRDLADLAGALGTILVILTIGVIIELLVFAPIERGVLRRRGLTGTNA